MNENERNNASYSDFSLGDDNEALIQRKRASQTPGSRRAVSRQAPTDSGNSRPVQRPVSQSSIVQRGGNINRSGEVKKATIPATDNTAPSRRQQTAFERQHSDAPDYSPASRRRPSMQAPDAASAPTTVRKVPENSAKNHTSAPVPKNQSDVRPDIPARKPVISSDAFSRDSTPSPDSGEAIPIRVKKSRKNGQSDDGKALFSQRGAKASDPSVSRRAVSSPDKKTDIAHTGTSSKTSPAGISVKGGADMMSSIIKAIIYMVLVVVVAVFISIFVIRIGNDVFAFVKSDATLDVTIPEGATVEDISQILYGDGIIKYPSIFNIYAELKHDDGKFTAGNYTISPSMSYDELRSAFKEHIATGTSWITIPEGYSVDEIIDLMVENGIGKREKYIDVINNYDFDYWFIDELEANKKEGRAYRLEGYLFPDTYEFYNASSEEMVINKMLKRFDEVFVKDYKTKAQEMGYSVDDILTIASLIEKEAGGAADYMYVSSVFHNRLRNPWNFPCLESDATVIYAIQTNTGVRPTKVTPDDLKINSPYNTYQNAGLTPGPITNPSASAIRYALYPAPTDYYFFVTADSGKAFYAVTKPEHDQNIEKVKQLNES